MTDLRSDVVAIARLSSSASNWASVRRAYGLAQPAAAAEPGLRDVLEQLSRCLRVLMEGGLIGNPKYAGLNTLRGKAQLLQAVGTVVSAYESGASDTEVAQLLVREVGPVGAVQVAVALSGFLPGLMTGVRLLVAIGERRIAVGDEAAEHFAALRELLRTSTSGPTVELTSVSATPERNPRGRAP